MRASNVHARKLALPSMGPTRGEKPTFGAYLQGLLDRAEWTQADLGRAADIHPTLIGRWIKGQDISVPNARAVAAALNRPLLEVLIAAGILTAEEAKAGDWEPVAAVKLTDDQLVAELRRRLETAAAPPGEISADEVEAGGDRYVTGRPKRSAKLVR